MNKAKERGKSIILSGFVTDKDGICTSIEVKDHEITHICDLEEDVDCHLILHIVKAGEAHFNIIIVLSNDTVEQLRG